MIELEFTKTIANLTKLDSQMRAASYVAKYDSVRTTAQDAGKVFVYITSALTTDENTECQGLIDAFVDLTTEESLAKYLDKKVYPFVKSLINVFASENITMGITSAGKTEDVLGLFVKNYDIKSNGLPISLKACLDTGSLYSAMCIIDYMRDNPTEYTGLSPFVTDARLLVMLNKIEIFLGITPLST